MTVAALALRDMLRDRFVLLCNMAMITGVLVPLLVLFGVKNGVHQAMIADLLRQPGYLQIDTMGNLALTADDLGRLADWPEIAFLTPRPRGQFDLVTIRVQGGRVLREATAIPSGPGDPNLPSGVAPGPGQVVLSPLLARQIDAQPGMQVQIVSQAEGRPRQLMVSLEVLAIADEQRVEGRSVFVPFAVVDLFEAFYDAYALPEHGITAGRPLSERQPVHAGLRVFARDLRDVAELQTRIEQTLGVATQARTRDIQATLDLGRNLDLAMTLTVIVAMTGLTAALAVGQWLEVRRKRETLAVLALMGMPAPALAAFPLAQAAATAGAGLALSGALYQAAALAAARMFGATGDRPITAIALHEAALICGGVLVIVLLSAAFAARAAMRMDPAEVLRQGGT